MLSARALMETFAVMAEFERQVTRLLKEKNLGGLDLLKTVSSQVETPSGSSIPPKRRL
jgi:hypothetical protein